MNRALFVAASGMAAQQIHLDVVADNLANADVAGFKQAEAAFTDVRVAGGVGLGVVSSGTHPVFEQGKLEKSGGPFDVAIDGTGFFIVTNGARTAYTRNGEFHRAPNGALETSDGWRVPGVRIPSRRNERQRRSGWSRALRARTRRQVRLRAHRPQHVRCT